MFHTTKNTHSFCLQKFIKSIFRLTCSNTDPSKSKIDPTESNLPKRSFCVDDPVILDYAPDGIYLDAESDGLLGEAFALCAIQMSHGKEIGRFVKRKKDFIPKDPWVIQHVYPHSLKLPETETLFEDFAQWWKKHNQKKITFSHMPIPVESNLFKTLYDKNLLSVDDGPYPYCDVSLMLLAHGYEPDSVDSFLKDHVILSGSNPHGCDYDTVAIILAVHLLMKKTDALLKRKG